MVDNVAITAGTGTTIATDDIGGVQYQRVKIAQGADGTGVDVSSAAPLNVTLANTGANTNKVLVTPDLPTGAATSAKQPTLGTAGASSTDVISVQGIASGTSLPVSVASIPSHAVTNAGTFAVQESGAGLTSLQLLDDTVVAGGTALGSTKSSLAGASVTTAAPTYTTGQINPLSMDTTGALRVTGGGAGTQYTEDVAAAADPVGSALMGIRRDTLSTSEVSADGDNIAIKATNKGQLHVLAAIDSTQLGSLVAGAVPTVSGGFEYEAVPVSQTDQILGATGAVGDYVEGLLCTVSTAATSQVQIKDGNGSAITVLPNAVGAGIGSYYIPLGILSVNATTPGWKVTTAAGVTVLATGNFT